VGKDYYAWSLYDELSVDKVAFLIAGHDPDDFSPKNDQEYVPQPKGVKAALDAIEKASESGQIQVKTVEQTITLGDRVVHSQEGEKSIKVDDLLKWLESKGGVPPLLKLIYASRLSATDAAKIDQPRYLNETDPCFSSKLKAAVDAWEAVSTMPKSKLTPKKDAEKWLADNAAKYVQLRNPDGSLNKSAIEEIAKIVGWKKGGPPKVD